MILEGADKLLYEELQNACQEIKNKLNITEELSMEDEIFNSQKWDVAWEKKCFLENSKKPEHIEKVKKELYDMWQKFQIINYALDSTQFRDDPVSYSFFWKFVQEQKIKIKNVMDELDKELAISKKGLLGEQYIQGMLDKYCYKYKKIENVVLEVDDEQGKTVEIDAIIIGEHEVFVCEIKNYGKEGQTLGIRKDGIYSIFDKRGKILQTYEKSPSWQNIRQYQSLDKLLRTELPDWNIRVVPLVIIANNSVQIRNYSQHNIIKPPELFYFLEKDTDIHFKIEEREEIERRIKKYIMPERKFEVFDVSDLTRLVENLFCRLQPYIIYNKKIYNLVKQYNEEQLIIREKQLAIREKKAALKKFLINCVIYILMAIIIIFCFYLLWLLLKVFLKWLWNLFAWSVLILVLILMLAGGAGSNY